MSLLKILGSGLLIVSLSLVGLAKSYNMIANVKLLSNYKLFLTQIKNQIKLSSFSIIEIIENSSDEISRKIKECPTWKRKSTSEYAELFQEKDKENVSFFLSSLGRLGKDEQIKNIDLQIEYITSRIKEEKEIFKEKSRVNIVFYSFLGVLGTLVLI